MLKEYDRCRNMYENKQKDDNFTDEEGEIFTKVKAIYTEPHVFCRNRLLFFTFRALGERIPRFKMYKLEARAGCPCPSGRDALHPRNRLSLLCRVPLPGGALRPAAARCTLSGGWETKT